MTADRRLHQCRHDGCTSQSEWQLMLQVRCTGGFMLKAPSTLMVCERHTKAAAAIATNDHAKWQLKCVALREGWGFPEFDSLVVMFAPVEHDKIGEAA
jgi:hypothetical protein